MKKKLYFKLSDGIDVNGIVMELSGIMAWIENDEPDPEFPKVYTITPIWLTDKEFNHLPEFEG